ncbi:MAG: hypothetical protein AAB425_04865 [Bdellovibrionota bacterium]
MFQFGAAIRVFEFALTKRSHFQPGTHREVLGSVCPLYAYQGNTKESIRLSEIMISEGRTEAEIWRGKVQLGAYVGHDGDTERGIKMMKTMLEDPSYRHLTESLPRITFHLKRYLATLLHKNGNTAESLRLYRTLEKQQQTWSYGYDPDLALYLLWDRLSLGALTPVQKAALQSYPRLPWRHQETAEVCVSGGDLGMIDLTNDEYRLDETLRLGIPLEVRLIAELVRAGQIGLHTNLVIELLWPNSIQLYPYLPDRLAKLVIRARKVHRFKITLENSVLRILDAKPKLPAVRTGPESLPTFLRPGRKNFMRQDIEKFYSLKRSRALDYLSVWLAKGLVKPMGNTRFFSVG